MRNIITRKCAHCKGIIDIDRNDLSNVIQFQKKYYHYDCFEELATQKASVKTGKPKMWQDALDNIWVLEDETKKMLEQMLAKDELNAWLLENYNITSVPTRFWQIVAELECGTYKGKRCKPVSITTLCGCWKWGQRKLNEINQYNRVHNKGPNDDNSRLKYDLAVIIGKIPNYVADKAAQKSASNDMSRSNIFNDDIDMSRIGQGKQSKKKDISAISDDIFTE